MFKQNNLINKNIVFTVVVIVITAILLLLPGQFDGAKVKGGVPAKGKVVEIDNSNKHQIGLINTGEQGITVVIKNGKYKNEKYSCVNHYMGKMEFDRDYKVGDTVFTVLELGENGKVHYANIIDYYRLDFEILLFLLFTVFLIWYSGWTGFKALVSFVFTGVMIWKVLLPGVLKGIDPLIISLFVTMVITAVIIFIVGGTGRKGVTAFLGACSGIIITLVLSIIFGKLFSISGGVKPFSEMLIYSGFPHLDLGKLFLSGVFISSSGAIMDIAMDVSASMGEVKEKKNDISRLELIQSGFSVGRMVIGTMSTTLLLAYSGGYATLLMVFIAQGTPILNIFNLQYVAAEILNTLVGSFGLVAVAPLTAVAGGFVYSTKRFSKKAINQV